jgi:hypothetical protein
MNSGARNSNWTAPIRPMPMKPNTKVDVNGSLNVWPRGLNTKSPGKPPNFSLPSRILLT